MNPGGRTGCGGAGRQQGREEARRRFVVGVRAGEKGAKAGDGGQKRNSCALEKFSLVRNSIAALLCAHMHETSIQLKIAVSIVLA
jgi:hypothetical protein